MKLTPLPVLLGLVMCSAIRAQVPTANQKIVIEVVDLQGAVHLPDSAKRQLVASLMHSEYAEESDWIADVEDKVSRAETEGWPDRENQGYIGFSVRATPKTLRGGKKHFGKDTPSRREAVSNYRCYACRIRLPARH